MVIHTDAVAGADRDQIDGRSSRRRAAILSLALLGLLPCGPSVAAASLDLLALQVYAKETILSARSDYEGPAAAGETIDLTDFEVGGDLSSGRQVQFRRGQVRGAVNAPSATLTEMFSSGRGTIVDRSLDLAAAKLDLWSARLAALPATTRVRIDRRELDGRAVTTARIEAQRDGEVVDLSAAELASAGPGQLQLDLGGSPLSSLIIRVNGPSVRLRDIGFSLHGGLEPARVLLFFPQATDLEINASGGAVGPLGQAWGIPASVVAPEASLRFAASTVTGQVLVRRILPIDGLPGGQVNRLGPAGAGDAQVASSILRRVDGSGPTGALAVTSAYTALADAAVAPIDVTGAIATPGCR